MSAEVAEKVPKTFSKGQEGHKMADFCIRFAFAIKGIAKHENQARARQCSDTLLPCDSGAAPCNKHCHRNTNAHWIIQPFSLTLDHSGNHSLACARALSLTLPADYTQVGGAFIGRLKRVSRDNADQVIATSLPNINARCHQAGENASD